MFEIQTETSENIWPPFFSHKSESERCETAASTLSTSFAAIIVIKPHLDHSFSVSTHMPVHDEPEDFKLKRSKGKSLFSS